MGKKLSYLATIYLVSVTGIGEMFIETGIIIELFMCGFLLKVHKNYFCNDVQIAKIHGLGYGISLVLAIYRPVIHLLSQPGTLLPSYLCTS